MSSEPLPLPTSAGEFSIAASDGSSITFEVPNGTISYTVTWPPGNALGALTNDGTGILSWQPVVVQNIIVNDALTNGQFTITQNGTGNSNMVFSDPVESWSVGVDQADGSKFKITDGAAHGGVAGTGDVFTVDSSGTIMLGNSVSRNSIFLNGGIEYQFDSYAVFPPAAPDTVSGNDLVLTTNHHVVKVTSSTYSGVLLPLASANSGRPYVIIRGFSSATPFEVKTQGADVFESGPDTSIDIPVQGGKVKVIGDGQNGWLLI
jgi:hypothetical protein